ncbi:MAG: hypothetical protein A2293_11350 [Elusimicrobia bacterium RIFOXYB2_FULL_49_7]|nr:MAG: hypothetical protein A2293_11350 [Elusimicrobia bacterium RIFOXYB2_FULL_49_7]
MILIRFHGRYAYLAALERGTKDVCPIQMVRYAPLGASPVELCRLGYLGSEDEWEYSFFKYSDERYEQSVCASGHFTATPEHCFDTSAGVYFGGLRR